jgi:Zn-dependent M28 family amino/carboxypeptidase
VWLVSFGCEECGIRGSKRFIERHREDIRDAYVLNLDMVGGKGTRLRVVTKEERNLIRLSPAVVQLVEEAAGEAGIPLQKGPIIAFTDAMAFAVKGIQATTLMALDEKGMVDTYHSLEDRPERLDYDLLFDSYRLCLAFLKHVDARSESPARMAPEV